MNETDMPNKPEIHGGKILANALASQGVEYAFGVPGESFLALLDGLYDQQNQIEFVTCRQEGGAAYMADAYAKLTGKVGVLMVTRGPGASNAMVGVHTAYQDSTPMVVFVGQVSSEMIEREAFQEMDFRQTYSQCAKWVGSIDRVDRINEYVSKAFHLAQSGRMGPVVLALPEDILSSLGPDHVSQQAHRVQPGVDIDAFAHAQELLEKAKNPIIVLGGSSWDASSCADLQRFAEDQQIPVVSSFRYQDLIDNESPAYAGFLGLGINPKLVQRVTDADVVLVIGDRLGEITTLGYTLFTVPQPKQAMIHVHPGANELGFVYQPTVALNCAPTHFVKHLIAANLKLQKNTEWYVQARRDQEAFQVPLPIVGNIQLAEIFTRLNEVLPKDTIITNGAGNFTTWLHRYYSYSGFKTQLAPANGSMGYGLPAAIVAKIAMPDRTVVCIAGDGDVMMNIQELATGMKYQAKPIVIILNNGMYGTIRMHQEREYKQRVSGTFLTNPDFVLLAKSFDMQGYRVTKTEEFFPALQDAIAHGQGALIELITEPNAITPTKTLQEL
ncbi:thiamine pyrophosphate-binding protein [Polynucleobacter rarus]|uniref:thiamine pyrophosphate-binding protein n=1 Tax=Polynucleobacter rarus TaxID=556055 RepID=UPI001B8854C9|nr:thiamine pyrophosphate-binding protein [Polynucleobacter rarus]